MRRLSSNHTSVCRSPMICGAAWNAITTKRRSTRPGMTSWPGARRNSTKVRAELVEWDDVKATIAKRLGER